MNFANETKFRQHVVAAIRKGGGFAQQIESPTLRGIPDVFYKNAHFGSSGWLELKVVRPGDKFTVDVSGAQWRWMTHAAKAGVMVRVLAWDQKNSCLGMQTINPFTEYSDLRDLAFYDCADFSAISFDEWITSL